MSKSERSQNGFVILVVLIAVAIMMLLYFVQIDTLFGPGLPSQPAGLEQHPWVLEALLVPEGETTKLPRRPQLQLDEPFTLTLPVTRNDTDRGALSVVFDTNGRIRSQWQCSYEQDGIMYQVDAETSGNINAGQTYRDESGKDKSRLFFIAKGQYTKTPLARAPDVLGEKGQCWLTGWIRPDRTIQGHITLTTNQQWAAVYAFKGPE